MKRILFLFLLFPFFLQAQQGLIVTTAGDSIMIEYSKIRSVTAPTRTARAVIMYDLTYIKYDVTYSFGKIMQDADCHLIEFVDVATGKYTAVPTTSIDQVKKKRGADNGYLFSEIENARADVVYEFQQSFTSMKDYLVQCAQDLGGPFEGVYTEFSVVGVGLEDSKIKLSGDLESPGNWMYYGTDGAGTKGWYSSSSVIDTAYFLGDTLYLILPGGDTISTFIETIEYLNDLGDVDTVGIGVNEFLMWDGTNWVPQAVPTPYLNTLPDVDTANISNGDFLMWDSIAGNWIPQEIPPDYLNNLPDVDTANIDIDDILQWDGSNWIMTSPVELIGDGGGAYGSGLAGRTAYWLDDSTLVHTAITYSSTELNASALTGSLQWPTGTTAQQPVGANGKTRFNSTTGLFEGYHDAAYRPFATFDGTRTSGRVPYWDGTKLTTSDGFVFDASVQELRINTAGVDMGSEKLQVNGSGVFGTPSGDRIIIGGSSGEIYTAIWNDNLRLGARSSVATSYIDVMGDGKVDIIAQDNDTGDGVHIKNDGGGTEVIFDLLLNRIDLHGNYTIRGATSNHVTLMGGDVYCTGCTSPGPRGYDVFIRGGKGNNLSNRRGFGGDVFIQAYDSMAVAHTLMQFMPDNFTILTPKVVEPTTSWDWVYVMDADSMRKVTAADIVAAGSGSINSIYNLLPTQDVLIDPNANDLVIGSFGAGNSGDFEFFTTNEDGQYAGIFAGTRDSSWLATAGDGFQFDAALFSTGAEDGVMGVNYEYFGTVWNAAVFGDSMLFAPYPGSELNMTINGLPDDPVNPYKVMVQDTVTDRVYLTSIDSLLGSGTAGTLPIWNADGTLGNSSLTEASGVLSSSLTGALKLPAGTTAQQPVGVAGQLRHNTTTGELEWYSGSAFENLSYYFTKSGANVSLKDYNGAFTIPLSASNEFRFNGNTAQFYNGTNSSLYLSLGYNGSSNNDTGILRLGGGGATSIPSIEFYQTSNRRTVIGYDVASVGFDNSFAISPGNSSNAASTNVGVGFSMTSSAITQRFFSVFEQNRTFVIDVARIHGTTVSQAHNMHIQSGAPKSGQTDHDGGELSLRSGVSTGSGSSFISLYTASPGASGTTDRNPSEKVRITGSGTLAVGTTSPDASALVQIESTTRGFLPPRMTTVERDAIGSPAAGLVIFNTTTTKLECYDGATWQAAW